MTDYHRLPAVIHGRCAGCWGLLVLLRRRRPAAALGHPQPGDWGAVRRDPPLLPRLAAGVILV